MNLFKTPRYFSWIFPKRTWGFSLDKSGVYLTFDDGPNPVLTPWILEFLRENDVKATFFCVGKNIQKYPELFVRIKTEGHQIGNHCMQHENGVKTSWKVYRKSIDETAKLVGNTLFRPPYGRISMWRSAIIAKEYKIIMWSWLSNDFDEKVSIVKILKKAKSQISGGQIIVLHDNDNFEKRVKEILPMMVKIIQNKGLQFRIISA